MRQYLKSIAIVTAFGVSTGVTACNDAPQNPSSQTADIIDATSIPPAFLEGQETLKIAESFLTAAGSGDGETLNSLMADDFVWHNEGDDTIPWIGNWKGKDVVFGQFMPAFSTGLKTTGWTTDYKFASGDQAVFMGTMSAIANKSGLETGTFNWAVRVNVQNGKVKSWNWFEDSFAISQAYHGGSR